MCNLVTLRRQVMANQVRLRRQIQQEEELGIRPTPTLQDSSHNNQQQPRELMMQDSNKQQVMINSPATKGHWQCWQKYLEPCQ